MPNDIQALFDQLWKVYTGINQVPDQVFQSISKKEPNIINDHIALRTFNPRCIGMNVLAQDFLDLGYKIGGSYKFEKKKLDAIHLEHENPECPRVFISELHIERLSHRAQDIIQGLISQMDIARINDSPVCLLGRPWDLNYKDYEALAQESEYAGWLAAHGFVPNHFTISLNHLNELTSLEKINQFVKDSGVKLNDSGGEIKGSPEELLEQSSTAAEMVEVKFYNRTVSVPGCFIEFAKRYIDQNGKLFSGFVTNSADKIFESTDTSQAA